MAPSDSWKLVLAVALFGSVVASARARPPGHAIPALELRRLVLGAMSLYGVGLVSLLTHRLLLAIVLYSGGIVVSSLAAYLSRGADPSEPPREDEPADEQPPPSPDGTPGFDWASFQRELEAYAEQRRDPVQLS